MRHAGMGRCQSSGCSGFNDNRSHSATGYACVHCDYDRAYLTAGHREWAAASSGGDNARGGPSAGAAAALQHLRGQPRLLRGRPRSPARRRRGWHPGQCRQGVHLPIERLVLACVT